jgi:Peptidase A4 family
MQEHPAAWGRPEDAEVAPWHAVPEELTTREWLRAHPAVLVYGIVALATCVVLSAVAILVNDPMASPGAVPPNQAGYLWCCSVKDVSASWVVPQLVHPAQEGAEAVWIGAQTQDGGFFLQVGTNEYVSEVTSQYQAFWSDGPLNGSPQNMGTLSPGDQVRARLDRSQRGWVITFTDATQGWTHTKRILYEARDANALAEWIEEDPVAVDPHGSTLFHMAVTHGTRVSDLLVNGQPPVFGSTQPETFVDGSGTTFAPTELVHDGFGFRPW